jgi:hypothetical protein
LKSALGNPPLRLFDDPLHTAAVHLWPANYWPFRRVKGFNVLAQLDTRQSRYKSAMMLSASGPACSEPRKFSLALRSEGFTTEGGFRQTDRSGSVLIPPVATRV